VRHIRAFLPPLILLAAAPALRAQDASAPADFAAAPGGGKLASLRPGAPLTRGGASNGWREATLSGWLPESAVRRGGGGSYPLVVQGAAALHADPGGLTVATLSGGMVVAEVERRGGWVHVRRSGWVRDGATATPASTAPRTDPPPSPRTPAPAKSNTPRPAQPAAPQPAARRLAVSPAPPPTPAASAPRPAPSTPMPAPRAAAPARQPVPAAARASVASPHPPAPAARAVPVSTSPPARKQPMVLHGSPAGATVAVVDPDAPVQVLGREGEWTRVRVEGWTRSPVAASAAAPGAVTLRAIDADPDAFRGRDVEWTLRFVSLQVADALRTDFTPGETFILARDPNGETGFVYVAVAPELLGAVRRLAAFQQFRIAGRIRTGRSPMMGHPIVDLVRLL
jgi:hypothetical protein